MDDFATIARLTRAEAQAAARLGDDECRFIVDAYYQMQDNRIRSKNQIRSMAEGEEPNLVLTWLLEQNLLLEKQLKRSLDAYSQNHVVGSWMREVDGIGPVISAGILAHIDITKAPTVGHIWSYAGLQKSVIWIGGAAAEKALVSFGLKTKKAAAPEDILEIARNFEGCPKWLARRAVRAATGLDIPELNLSKTISDLEYVELVMGDYKVTYKDLIAAISKRPWNAELKRLCWLLGESFAKVCNKESAVYGKIYAQRKALENARNAAGEYSDQAAAILAKKKIGKDTDAYKAYSQGTLPPAQIYMRAKRYAVKRFLSDLHTVWYWLTYDRLPPNPYAVEFLGHAHFEVSDSLKSVPDLYQALLKAGATPAKIGQ